LRLPLNRVAVTLGPNLGYFDASYSSSSIGAGPWVAVSLGVEGLPVCHFVIDVQADGGIIGDTAGSNPDPAGRALFGLALGYRAGPCK
jgi:hypothetical protein